MNKSGSVRKPNLPAWGGKIGYLDTLSRLKGIETKELRTIMVNGQFFGYAFGFEGN